ncbi:MAG TPA: hypothetical protein VFD70_12115 [Anaerolineae bacterium]|nr:hypothetical protein [Anaerolineae bacterium]
METTVTQTTVAPTTAQSTVSFQTFLEDLRPEILARHDPLLRLFYRLFPTSSWPLLLVALPLYTALIFAAGFAISDSYRRAGLPILASDDPRTLYFDIFAYFIFIPLVWLFYTWQPRGLWYALASLASAGIVGERKHGLTKPPRISLRTAFDNRLNLLIALGWTVFALAVWVNSLSVPQNPWLAGYSGPWFTVNPLYFWLVWVPLVYATVYMIAWIFIRQVAITLALNQVFRSFEIKPMLFHPDGVNGLGAIGDFAIRMGLLVVLLGFWVALGAIYPTFFGQSVNIKFDIMFTFAVYICCVPLTLLPPVWGAHQAMLEVKTRLVRAVAEPIEALIADVNPEHILMNQQLLNELERRYQVIHKEFHTWPFRVVSLQGFGITFVLPILTALLPFFLERAFR